MTVREVRRPQDVAAEIEQQLLGLAAGGGPIDERLLARHELEIGQEIDVTEIFGERELGHRMPSRDVGRADPTVILRLASSAVHHRFAGRSPSRPPSRSLQQDRRGLRSASGQSRVGRAHPIEDAPAGQDERGETWLIRASIALRSYGSSAAPAGRVASSRSAPRGHGSWHQDGAGREPCRSFGIVRRQDDRGLVAGEALDRAQGRQRGRRIVGDAVGPLGLEIGL